MLQSKSQLDDNIWMQLPNLRKYGVKALFENYWKTAHVYFPILDEATIRLLYDTLADGQFNYRRACILRAIIFSVLALSALYEWNKEESEYYY